jgi:SecD/SecF fusion protein
MNQDTKYRFIFIVLLTAVFAYVVAPIPNKPRIPGLADAKVNRGIDLAGGAELRYRVLYEPGEPDKAQKTRDATDVIRRRIEARQLKEPRIYSQGDDQIVIQLAGVDRSTLEDYKRLIQQAGKLSLHAVASKEVQEKFNQDGRVPDGYMKVPVDPENRPRTDEYAAWNQAEVLVQREPVIEGRNITSAEPHQRMIPGGLEWVTDFRLDTEGGKRFDEAARVLYHQRPPGMIAIILDGKLRSMPVVQSESFGGSGQISGAKNEQEARDLAIILRSGSLPAPIGFVDRDGKRVVGQPESETFVGPTLGQDAIRRGLWASGLTLAVVSVFMIAYYRKAGFIAVISLFLNLLFLVGVMAFFNATLTLPGIAGIVLTVGMAVDANILILERIREEQARGKSALQAFEAGHERAFSAILDGNLTTLVAAIVLYYFGTGPVQGFAVTLSIGIATTLFSVLFCAKTFLRMAIQGGLTEFRMMRFLAEPKVDFLRVAKPCVIASVLMVGAGTAFFLARGEKNFGIDFRGGSLLAFRLTEESDIDAVRRTVFSIKGPDGLAKYPDAEVQTVADPHVDRPELGIGSGRSRNFQVRTAYHDVVTLKDDIQEAFKDTLSHEPFREMKPEEVNPNPRFVRGHPPGPGLFLYVKASATTDDVRRKIAAPEGARDFFRKDEQGEPLFVLEEAPGAPRNLRALALTPTREDAEREGWRSRLRDRLKVVLAGELAEDPFIAQGTIGPAVARELKDSTVWAMIISWALMIVYIAIRFASWRYGVAAVAALVHDALVALAFTSLAGAVVPKSWGLSFEMNLTTMAAILTIIGYSINDTIVIFDRIRENLVLMKKATFREIVNASVNQTLSRTILTAVTVWISAAVLYAFTMNTGGGIAEFAFPLLIGVIAGTYSTIYIASPIVLWWYRGQRPPTA